MTNDEIRRDEMLSAYVDGELTDAELAAVERRLRDDPQARELVAEIRAVSETLRSLPRHKLGADLREAVLQQAVVHREPVPTDAGSARRWAWAALALAAALLLTIYLPETGQNEQQLAQGEAKKWEGDQSAPQLVAPADEPAAGARLIAESAPGPPAFSGTLEGSVVSDAKADRTAPGDNLAAIGQVGGALPGGAIQSPQSQPIADSSAEVYEVHLTPGNPQVGPVHFDQLLASHGIALRNEASVLTGRGGVATTQDADDKLDQRSASKPVAVEAELVLVEAPLEEIQRIVAACSGKDSPWKSLRLVGRENSNSSLALLANEKLKSPAPAETGVAIALDSLHLGDESADGATPKAEEQAEPPSPQQASPPARGWATHLGRDQIAPKPGAESVRERKLADLRGPAGAERQDASPEPPVTIRVLFILHPAAE